MLELRESLGKTQDEFAKILGVSRNYVSLIEIGKKPLTSKMRRKIGLILGGNEEKVEKGSALCEKVSEKTAGYLDAKVSTGEHEALRRENEAARLENERLHAEVQWLRETVRKQQEILEKTLLAFERKEHRT